MAKRDGLEPRDDRPVALPVGFKAPTEVDRLHGLMARLIVDMRGQKETESFEESLDFEVDDDEVLPVTHSEMRFMTEEKLLTDAKEASTKVNEHVAHNRWRDKYVRKDGVAGDRKGSGDAGEKRSTSGGEGRSAGERGGRVSESGSADSGVGKESGK